MQSMWKSDRIWTRVRRWALIATGVWCVALGIALGGVLIGTQTLASTNTAALMMIVGVIVLPACTMFAIHQDRRIARRVSRMQGAENKAFASRDSVVHDRHHRATRHNTHTTRTSADASSTTLQNV